MTWSIFHFHRWELQGARWGDSKAPSDDATWQNCRVGKVGLGGKRIFVSWHSLEGGKLGWLSTWTEFGK